MESTGQDNWKLICPPKNWQEPVIIEDRDLSLLSHVSARLGLVITKDEKRKKIILGPSLERETDPAVRVRYPSGWTADVVFDEDAGEEYWPVDMVVAAPLVAAFPDAQVSKHFRLSDFRPGRHAYDYIRLLPGLVQALEDIRHRCGRPIRVLSGYRPAEYNEEVGGTRLSTHVDGLAADIYCDGLSIEQFCEICLEVIGFRGGVGCYLKSGFIHVDLRGYQAFWYAR